MHFAPNILTQYPKKTRGQPPIAVQIGAGARAQFLGRVANYASHSRSPVVVHRGPLFLISLTMQIVVFGYEDAWRGHVASAQEALTLQAPPVPRLRNSFKNPHGNQDKATSRLAAVPRRFPGAKSQHGLIVIRITITKTNLFFQLKSNCACSRGPRVKSHWVAAKGLSCFQKCWRNKNRISKFKQKTKEK